MGVLIAAAAVGLVLRAGVALGNAGIYWPDEIYQGPEPAHRLAFGYGALPWEYVAGARTWVWPGLLAAVERLAGEAGSLIAVRLLMVALSAATLVAAWWLARRLGASPRAAAVTTAALACWPVLIYFAPRALTEEAVALPVTLGLALALPRSARPWQVSAGAALLALATAIRLQCGLVEGGLLLVLFSRRSPTAWLGLGVVASGALALGGLDRLTWGHWFQSVEVYVRFNLLNPGGWGVLPLGYFLTTYWALPGGLAAGLGLLALIGGRRSPALLAVVLLFVLAHSLVPHKEFRFVLPILPSVGPLAALGLDELHLQRLSYALAAWALLSLLTLPGLTFQQLGAYTTFRGPTGEATANASAWGDADELDRLMAEAGRQPDLCGLDIPSTSMPWTGGYTYLDRPVPLYTADHPALQGSYNYLIAAVRDGWRLERVSAGCSRAAPVTTRLP